MKESEFMINFWEFQETVKKERRYFRNNDMEIFLETIVLTSKKRKVDLPKDKYLWRAQLGYDWNPLVLEEQDALVPYPYSPKRMKPLSHSASEGRANPKGIPYLYLASDKDTAIAEVRPRLGSLISVGQFKTEKDLIVIDCSGHYDSTRGSFTRERILNGKKGEDPVWTEIDSAFSNPIADSDKVADYVPTQIIAEKFLDQGLDGIIYKSLLGAGYNIVLFDIKKANLVNCGLFEVDKINISFKQTNDFYSIRNKHEQG